MVTAVLPRAQPPAWFVPALVIPEDTTVIVVDGDDSIHAVWCARLSQHLEHRSIQMIHYTSLREFRASCERLRSEQGPRLILMDYEFRDAGSSGLECHECMGLARGSVLVTSRAQDPKVRARCESLGIGLLPKSASAFVPLRFSA